MAAYDILTIGHSNHPIEVFFDTIRAAGGTELVDVRTNPVSRWNPHFEQSALTVSAPRAGLGYRWAGRFLGGRPSREELVVDGIASYPLMAETAEFSRGIERVTELAQQGRPVLVCSERDPLDCHRCLLVSRRLVADGLRIGHIPFTGAVEIHDELEERLVAEVTKARGGKKALEGVDDVVAAAYAFRSGRVAWRAKHDADGEAR